MALQAKIRGKLRNVSPAAARLLRKRGVVVNDTSKRASEKTPTGDATKSAAGEPKPNAQPQKPADKPAEKPGDSVRPPAKTE